MDGGRLGMASNKHELAIGMCEIIWPRGHVLRERYYVLYGAMFQNDLSDLCEVQFCAELLISAELTTAQYG